VTRYAITRLLGAIPLVLGVATVVFFVINLAPGDPSLHFVTPGMSGETIAQVRSNFGLDAPLHIRYLKWISSLATGELGYSFSHRRPVLSVIAASLPNTLLLSGLALVVAFGGGILLGTYQALRRTSWTDVGLNVALVTVYSIPAFWLGLMLILVFSVMARGAWDWPVWLPSSGMVSTDHEALSFPGRIGDHVAHLVLPVLTLAAGMMAAVARFMRAGVLEVLDQEHVRAARAKGLSERAVVLGHVMRNALIPVVTLLGLYLPVLFSGAVLVEYVFAWPGMGRVLVESIASRDYPLILAGSILFAVVVVIGNLLADLLYAVVDPRVRHG